MVVAVQHYSSLAIQQGIHSTIILVQILPPQLFIRESPASKAKRQVNSILALRHHHLNVSKLL